ncbi:MAG: OB-fold nucleic acid binding domain-containing protein [Clostridia bacterium]|nr:OB-fold nucleic acid binding domain-containing protein [Clostridia bacterium]
MKQIKIILLLVLVFSLVVGSLTSCDVLEKLGINIPGSGDNNPSDDEGGDDVIDPANCGHYVTTVKNQKAASCKEEGYTGDKVCYACGTLITAGKAIPKTADHKFKDGVCTVCGVVKIDESETVIAEWKAQYQTITVSEALTLCEQFVEAPSEARYYIVATVKSVDNASFGQLTIEDETGEMMVYGTNSSDGSLKYDQMDVELKAGDLILIYGTLQNYKSNTKEVQNAWLIDHYAKEVVPPSIDVEPDSTITIEKALEIAGYVGANDHFYITGTVVSVTKPQYGAMIITDGTNEISVYGSYSADGSVGYADMEDKPYKGDTVTVYATLQLFNGTAEIKNAWITEFEHAELDINPDDYTLSTIADARLAADDEIVKVEGVVARITFANGFVPSGFILVDSTSSIYVYDGDAAGRVKIGNKVTIVGAKDHWILDTEQSNADRYGYKGCNQITNVVLVDNDNGNNAFDTSWITESTVKDIIDTPFTEDVTTLLFKVNALITRVPASGFTNYYINDLDGETGTYTYTQCNGNDFDWLDQFDGKICTVYLTALNAKSTGTGCNWRFIPVAVIDENFVMADEKIPAFVVDYHGKAAFEDSYMVDAKIELPTSVASELLGFEGATLSYTVNDSSVAEIVVENDKVYLKTLAKGTVTVTVKGEYGNYSSESTVTITVNEAVTYETITPGQAIAAENDTEVIVKGIVGPSAVNQKGTFYLIGSDGAIPVQGFNADEIMAGLSIGDEIIVKGTRTITKDGGGQILIDDAVILANYYGEHDYSTDSFIKNMTMEQIKAIADTPEATTGVYVITTTVEKTVRQQGAYTNVTFNAGDILLYSGSASQYSWLEAFFAEGETSAELKIELALCDWNAKGLKGCVLAVYDENNEKVYNTLNFNN